MPIYSIILMQLMAAYTVFVEPFLRINFYRRLKKQLSIDPSARILFYRTQVLWEWSWVVVLILIVVPLPNPLEWLGLTLPKPIGWIFMFALVLGVGMSIILLRRNPGAMERMQRSLQASAVLLPSTPAERKWYAAMAITVGICEELLYRGFLMSYLTSNFPMLSGQLILVPLISGIIYGLSRAYLGFKGMVQAALTGFGFAVVYFLSGSILPAMVFHILAELRSLMLWQPVEVKKKK